MSNFGAEIILEAKEYYRKEYVTTVHSLRRKSQLKNLNVFDAYIEYEKGVSPFDLAFKYKYPIESFFFERLRVVKARISVYIKLKELGNV